MFKGLATKHTTVKWSITQEKLIIQESRGPVKSVEKQGSRFQPSWFKVSFVTSSIYDFKCVKPVNLVCRVAMSLLQAQNLVLYTKLAGFQTEKLN